MTPFVYTVPAARVVFGSGTRAALADEDPEFVVRTRPDPLHAAAAKRCRSARHRYRELAAGIFSEAAMHTPVDVTERAVLLTRDLDTDCVVAVGRGSSLDLPRRSPSKTDLPQIVLPTTYAGSEANAILSQTAGKEKRTLRSLKVQPEVVIYDVDLTLTLWRIIITSQGDYDVGIDRSW